MRRITINVGLSPGFAARNSGLRTLTEGQRALRAVEWSLEHIHGPVLVELRRTSPENCLILAGNYEGKINELKDGLKQLAVLCEQDCVAALIEGYGGVLEGPRAASWRPFDPSQFIHPTGTQP